MKRGRDYLLLKFMDEILRLDSLTPEMAELEHSYPLKG